MYTGADASFSLYEDNGVTYAYEKGEYSTIPFSYEESGKELTIGTRSGSFPEMAMERNIKVIFVTPEYPAGKEVSAVYKGEQLTISLS